MNTESFDYLSMQAWLHLRYDRLADAILLLEGLAVLRPDDPWVRRTLGYAYLRNGDFQNCLDQLNRLVANKVPADRLLRVRALTGLGRREEAGRMVQELGGKLT